MAEPFNWNLQPCNKTHINELKLYFHILMREKTLKNTAQKSLRSPKSWPRTKHFKGDQKGKTKNRSIQQ